MLAPEAGSEVSSGASWAELGDPGDELGASGDRVLELLQASHASVHLIKFKFKLKLNKDNGEELKLA